MSETKGYLDMELLRFTTAGSVDDGKSTLIGRLLYDSKAIFEDQLNYKEILILGASPQAYEILKFYFKWYDKKRIKKKIKVKIIAYDRKITNIPLAEIRYLPKKYESPVAMNIYGNKTAIILWAEKPIVIAIREKEIADSYRNHFELMWKLAKP